MLVSLCRAPATEQMWLSHTLGSCVAEWPTRYTSHPPLRPAQRVQILEPIQKCTALLPSPSLCLPFSSSTRPF